MARPRSSTYHHSLWILIKFKTGQEQDYVAKNDLLSIQDLMRKAQVIRVIERRNYRSGVLRNIDIGKIESILVLGTVGNRWKQTKLA